MCIIQGYVDDVSNTNILVGTVRMAHDLQLTIYSNNVELGMEEPVAMILPFPNFSKRNILHVLKSTPEDNQMFKELSEKFLTVNALIGKSATYSFSSNIKHNFVEVKRSGSYRYSVVFDFDDFARLDNSVFKLSDPNIASILRSHYEHFGFVICILDKSAEYLPFMYISEKLPDYKYFIPTRHYHGHLSEQDEWDHRLYIMGTTKEPKYNIPGISAMHPYDFNICNFPRLNRIIDTEDVLLCGLRIQGFVANSDIVVGS